MGLLGATAFAASPARPGAVNYVEGAAYLDGQRIDNQNVGNSAMDAGQELTTGKGRAEILLTPGIFLRLDNHSGARMISPDLTHTQVQLEHGRASVEVDQISPQNDVEIEDGDVNTQVVKTGYYEFDAEHPEAMVFKGQAEVQLGNNKWEEIKGHHELALGTVANGAHGKTTKFDPRDASGDLYNWSSLRSQYLSQANNQIAAEYQGEAFNPGWYWDPYGWDYTFIGAGPFMSPFGWGFYPWGGWGGFGGGYYGGGLYGRRIGGGNGAFRGVGGFRGGVGSGGTFRGVVGGGSRGGGGGGFHGGGGRR